LGLKNVRVLLIIVLAINVIDLATGSDLVATFEVALVLTIFANLVKGYFEVDPYAMAGAIEYLGLFTWLFGSIFWNLYVLHSYADQSAAYTAGILAFMLPALAAGFGVSVAYVVIEEGKKVLRSF
jgi:hypothetical protein